MAPVFATANSDPIEWLFHWNHTLCAIALDDSNIKGAGFPPNIIRHPVLSCDSAASPAAVTSTWLPPGTSVLSIAKINKILKQFLPNFFWLATPHHPQIIQSSSPWPTPHSHAYICFGSMIWLANGIISQLVTPPQGSHLLLTAPTPAWSRQKTQSIDERQQKKQRSNKQHDGNNLIYINFNS